MMNALERWQQGWSGTKLVVVANRPRMAFSDESRTVIQEARLDLVETSLRDEKGRLNAAVEQAEVLVASVGLDAEAFARLGRVRFVLRPYVGYDDIDVEAASDNGILVGNVPDTFIEEVANHALALILA